MEWFTFFQSTFDIIHQRFATVLAASSCREGWLQGEQLFIHGIPHKLEVNQWLAGLASNEKVDLVCRRDPRMVAEIKIVAADHQPKMQDAVDGDVQRLSRIEGEFAERYMMLVIPTTDHKTGRLAHYLDTCDFSPDCRVIERPGFRVKIWRLQIPGAGGAA